MEVLEERRYQKRIKTYQKWSPRGTADFGL